MKKEEKWGDAFRGASEAVSQWRDKHPRATFSAIEKRVDEQLAKIRAEMIQDLVLESPLTNFKEVAAAARPRSASSRRAALSGV